MTPSGSLWRCQCECGGFVERVTTQLRRGGNPGCRVCEPDRRAAVHTKHGASPGENRGGKTRLYRLWKDMTRRCRNPSHISYAYYGAKGIRVCAEWLDFGVFREWSLANGYEDGLSIERRRPSEDYAPGNCEWITRGENSRRAVAMTRERRALIRLTSLGLGEMALDVHVARSEARGWG